MTGNLLWRGMLAGILAALLATLFARVATEPQVDRAIAFEAAHEGHHHDHSHDHADAPAAVEEPEPVSRATQKGIGLLTAMALYGAAIGGIFALVFAYSYGRLARIGPRSLSAMLALLAFIVIALVPALKYPPNPPAVGQGETIQTRTIVYFAMIAASIVAAIVAHRIGSLLRARWGLFDATLASIAVYVVLIAIVQGLLPTFDEVPEGFPAQTLWTFRLGSIGIQAILWATIGLAFGRMAERVIRASAPRR